MQPRLIVAMGATAAQSVFGKAMPVGVNRGRIMTLHEGASALITVHPSFLLRTPEPDKKEQAYRHFVADLRLARETVA